MKIFIKALKSLFLELKKPLNQSPKRGNKKHKADKDKPHSKEA